MGFTALTLPAVLMRPLALTELSQKADLVVLGTVQSKTCQRDAEGRIFTKVTLAVSEVWKGTATNTTLTIVHGGGTIGDERAEVACQVEYAAKEEVVAFLVINPSGELVTLGLAQGEFHVRNNATNGEKLVHNVYHGVARPVAKGSSLSLVGATAAPTTPLTLSALKQTVTETKP